MYLISSITVKSLYRMRGVLELRPEVSGRRVGVHSTVAGDKQRRRVQHNGSSAECGDRIIPQEYQAVRILFFGSVKIASPLPPVVNCFTER